MGWTLALVAVAVMACVTWTLSARSAYEAPEFAVEVLDGDCEIREYPDLMLASTATQFQAQGNDGSFMRLFGFISGRNDTQQKIAMTVPVFIDRDANQSGSSMGFVIPKAVAEGRIPVPADETVEIRRRPAGRFAVIRFSGRLDEFTVREREAVLRRWMADRGLSGAEDVEAAGYDPPWTPGPLRRNEILIRLVSG